MRDKLLRLYAVQDWTGLSRSTIYLLMRDGQFPQSHKIGSRSVAWLESDIQTWIDEKVSTNTKGA